MQPHTLIESLLISVHYLTTRSTMITQYVTTYSTSSSFYFISGIGLRVYPVAYACFFFAASMLLQWSNLSLIGNYSYAPLVS